MDDKDNNSANNEAEIESPKAESASKPNLAHISMPEEAQDSDLIEKEWVEKAKQIVEHTNANPYEQQKALNAMKAEYLKKRYNKELKTEE